VSSLLSVARRKVTFQAKPLDMTSSKYRRCFGHSDPATWDDRTNLIQQEPERCPRMRRLWVNSPTLFVLCNDRAGEMEVESVPSVQRKIQGIHNTYDQMDTIEDRLILHEKS
jgi:hypothetical protein